MPEHAKTKTRTLGLTVQWFWSRIEDILLSQCCFDMSDIMLLTGETSENNP